MADVFISYKRRLRPTVERIAAALRGLKLSVWYDAGIEPGTSFSDEIAAEVREARAVLVLWTNDCFPHGGDKNGWVRAEAEIAKRKDKLVSTMVEATDFDPPWNLIHYEDLAHWASAKGLGPANDPVWVKVLARIGALTGRPGLTNYVAAAANGTSEALQTWAQAFPTDPLTEAIWAQIGTLAAEETRNSIAQARAADSKPKMQPFTADASGEGSTHFQEWLEKALNDDPVAQTFVAMCYDIGGHGVKQDHQKAFQWHFSAANLGNTVAMNDVGTAYKFGRGVAADDEMALNWYKLSADKHNQIGQLYLAQMLEAGRGVAKNLVEAIKYYKLAAEQGNKDAKGALKRLGVKP